MNSNSVVRIKTPKDDHKGIGALHLRVLIKGTTYQNGYYNWNGKNIRLINGKALPLSSIKKEFVDSNPILNSIHETVCVGAIKDGGVPHDLIRSDSNENLIRSTHSGNWITDEEFIDEIGS